MSLSPGIRGRSESIDIAKGIGISLVVLGHSYYAVFWGKLIYSFHMPLFFFLSGIWFDPKTDFLDLIKRRYFGLIQPLLLVAASWFIFSKIFQNMRIAHNAFYVHQLGAGLYFFGFLSGLSIWSGYSEIINVFPFFQTWFLIHLFVIQLVLWVVLRAIRWDKISLVAKLAFVLVLLGIGVGLLHPLHLNIPFLGEKYYVIGIPFGIDIFLFTAPFFLLGHILKKKMLDFEVTVMIALIIVSLFAMTWIFPVGDLDVEMRKFLFWPILIPRAIFGIMATLSISQVFSRITVLSRLFSVIGKNSLGILIFHLMFIGTASFILFHIGVGQNAIRYVAPFVAIAMCISAAGLWHNSTLIVNFLSTKMFARRAN